MTVNSIQKDPLQSPQLTLLDYASSTSEDILQVIEEEKKDLD